MAPGTGASNSSEAAGGAAEWVFAGEALANPRDHYIRLLVGGSFLCLVSLGPERLQFRPFDGVYISIMGFSLSSACAVRGSSETLQLIYCNNMYHNYNTSQ